MSRPKLFHRPLKRVKFLALISGFVSLTSFFGAVLVMAFGLHGEMTGLFPMQTPRLGVVWDCGITLLFPVLHSLLLSTRGRRYMAALIPGETGRHLVTTTFVIIASLQLIALFLLWSHLGQTNWRPPTIIRPFWELLYVSSWILLTVAMVKAGLGIQMGLLGWTSVLKGKPPHYPSFPTDGLYTVCRHPVYFAMALVSCTGPVWNIDHAIIAFIFTFYCVVGPLMKERRLARQFGTPFLEYRQRTPFFPTPRSVVRALNCIQRAHSS